MTKQRTLAEAHAENAKECAPVAKDQDGFIRGYNDDGTSELRHYNEYMRQKHGGEPSYAMIEYIPVNPLRLHPGTGTHVRSRYVYLKHQHPFCTPIQQIHNTLMRFSPDLDAAIASIQQSTKRLLADIQRYPDDAYELAKFLPYLDEFCELVQETSARLHNEEPAKREAIAQRNAATAREKQRVEEARERHEREMAAGDAYFGGTGAYQRLLDAHYRQGVSMEEYIASGDRIRAFRAWYRDSAQPAPEPVQVSLWEEAIA